MKRTSIIVGLMLIGLSQTAESPSDSADKQQTEGNTGITVEDLGRGLKSAVQNIEKEIPKIGSAIGNAVKKITEKEPEKPSPQEPAPQKK